MVKNVYVNFLSIVINDSLLDVLQHLSSYSLSSVVKKNKKINILFFRLRVRQSV